MEPDAQLGPMLFKAILHLFISRHLKGCDGALSERFLVVGNNSVVIHVNHTPKTFAGIACSARAVGPEKAWFRLCMFNTTGRADPVAMECQRAVVRQDSAPAITTFKGSPNGIFTPFFSFCATHKSVDNDVHHAGGFTRDWA